MKHAMSVLIIAFVLSAFAGAALAAEMSGEIAAVDAAKGTLTLKSGADAVVFDSEKGSLIKDVRLGDKVTVQYQERGGKKIATKVSPMKKVAPTGC